MSLPEASPAVTESAPLDPPVITETKKEKNLIEKCLEKFTDVEISDKNLMIYQWINVILFEGFEFLIPAVFMINQYV